MLVVPMAPPYLHGLQINSWTGFNRQAESVREAQFSGHWLEHSVYR
jgi:hypothetical protein